MLKNAMPYEKLLFFQKQIGLSAEELESLAPYRHLFVEKKDELAGFFYNRFYQITRTRMILEHEKRHGAMKEVWARWFQSLFESSWDESFFYYLWHSGLRHVEVNLDQSFINLGFCFIRQFCHQIVCSEIPIGSRGSILLTVNKMLDVCLLIETNAYMSATSYCDREVMKGISHQIRNPVTIIGGNAMRIRKKSEENSELYRACDNIILESMRLERLVKDIVVYLDVFQRESKYGIMSVGELVSSALGRLQPKMPKGTRIDVELDPSFPDVQGDPKDLEAMFYYLLENSMEALSPQNPVIEIKSRVKSFAASFLEVEIFNTGSPPKTEDLEDLSVPFSSSKPTGTGFGLPIARLAAKKNLASLVLLPLPEEGTKTIMHLPIPG
jgi:nitrogen-specific signal transduction histidine kinase